MPYCLGLTALCLCQPRAWWGLFLTSAAQGGRWAPGTRLAAIAAAPELSGLCGLAVVLSSESFLGHTWPKSGTYLPRSCS